MIRPLVLEAMLASVLILAACAGGATPTPTLAPTSTPAPTPTGLDALGARLSPSGYVLVDPSFLAIEGAQAYFGEPDGAAYCIEIPDNWNRRLLLWAHGFRALDRNLTVDPPPFRGYLIENGYAWGASSFSSYAYVPFEGAQETSALYDLFIQEFGQPEVTYIAGKSMGGNVTLLSLGLFPDRYDGALALCSAVGLGTLDYFGHLVVLGAYAAGVNQGEFDAGMSVAGLVSGRILPALETEPRARDLFESLVATLTGGPRPFRHEGFEAFYNLIFTFASLLVGSTGYFDNADFVYPVNSAIGVNSKEVNAGILRIRGDLLVRNVDPNTSDLVGSVPVPLIMVHTTGDGLVPISAMQIFRRLADSAGNGDLLVQRAIRASGHCEFSDQERIVGLEDLFAWVEDSIRAEGEEILGPLRGAGVKFTDPLREGDPGGL